jgi:hypothetical protein
MPSGNGLPGYMRPKAGGYLIDLEREKQVTPKGYMRVIFWDGRGYVIDFEGFSNC